MNGVPLLGYPDEPAGSLADRMIDAGVGRALIVDGTTGTLLGVVTRGDLLRVHARATGLERDYTAPLRAQGHTASSTS